MLLILLGCPNETTVDNEIEIAWNEEPASCVDGTVEFEPPANALLVSYRSEFVRDDIEYVRWTADVTAADGLISLSCEDDMTFLYAVAK